MATQLFLLDTVADTHLGTDNTNLLGTAVGWTSKALGTARGSGVVASDNVATVTGPTAGVTVTKGSSAVEWVSPPVAADVTIAGTITCNIWGAESAMTANVAINVRVFVIRANATATRNSNTLDTIATTAFTTELALTTRAVNNFTVTPTSTVVNRGDRLRVILWGDDSVAATMLTALTFNVGYNGTSASADGDSYVTFTENITFESAPTGSSLYLTGLTWPELSGVIAGLERKALLTRGSGVATLDTSTAAGWTAPIQITGSAGGSATEWYSPLLQAVTLGGMALANIRALESDALANASLRCEIARVAGDGTSPTVWASWCIAPTGTDNGELTTSQVARTANVSGDDLAITDGQRLRIRLYADDISSAAMAASQTITVYYNGTSGGASGDTYITFPQTLTEYIASTPGPASSVRQRTAHRFLTSR